MRCGEGKGGCWPGAMGEVWWHLLAWGWEGVCLKGGTQVAPASWAGVMRFHFWGIRSGWVVVECGGVVPLAPMIDPRQRLYSQM